MTLEERRSLFLVGRNHNTFYREVGIGLDLEFWQ